MLSIHFLQLPIISLMGISTTCPIHLNSLVLFTLAYDERKEKCEISVTCQLSSDLYHDEQHQSVP